MKSATIPVVLACLGALGCAGHLLYEIPKLPASLQNAPSAVVTRVGTWRVDVTPPPGPSTFGHGPDAIATQGYWTRLECRVFVLETGTGQSPSDRFAIIPCDLPAISYSLYREVAHHLEKTITADHILLTATHTHAGPGHYFESGIYSGVLSTRRAGFDNDMLDMLSARIALGVLHAVQQLTPAQARWVTRPVPGLTRNRDLEAFTLNGKQPTLPPGARACEGVAAPPDLLSSADKAKLQAGPCANLGAACEAVDPQLSTLELSALNGKPLGSISFFAMHPTVLPAHTRLFGADVFGVASRALEHEMRKEWASNNAEPADPLAALVNTNEGDIVPVWSLGDVDEARSIGGRLAAAAWAAHADPTPPTPLRVATRFAEADMPKVPQLALDSLRPAVLGQGSSHGGSDHATTIDDITERLPDWVSGSGDQHNKQEPKTKLLAFLNHSLAATDGFPAIMPYSLWQLGDRWVAGVPAELTLTTGYRVRGAIAQAAGANVDHVIIAGLANSYMQYVATCEEFQFQHYEGGSTLYGQGTEHFISQVEQALACELADGASHACRLPKGVEEPTELAPFEVAPDADRTDERYPQPSGDGPRSAKLLRVCQLPRLTADTVRGPKVCVRWLDSPPGDIPLAARREIPGAWLGVRLKGTQSVLDWDPLDPGSALDDRTDDFQVRARAECDAGRYGYSAILDLTADKWSILNQKPRSPGNRARFELFIAGPTPGSAARLVVPFDDTTPGCSRDEMLYCSDQYDAAAAPLPMACH